MAERISIWVDGRRTDVTPGTTVAAAISLAGKTACRDSISGQRRGPVCGMGICAECRVTINGQPHQRSCLIRCLEGMEVSTHG